MLWAPNRICSTKEVHYSLPAGSCTWKQTLVRRCCCGRQALAPLTKPFEYPAARGAKNNGLSASSAAAAAADPIELEAIGLLCATTLRVSRQGGRKWRLESNAACSHSAKTATTSTIFGAPVNYRYQATSLPSWSPLRLSVYEDDSQSSSSSSEDVQSD